MPMVSLVSRQGRQLQRYSNSGRRLVVGCIPYKFNMDNPCKSDLPQAMEVLVVSSQKGCGMMFPKGGWETNETITQAASREALEEAGVQGNVERRLGKWRYQSKTQPVVHEGIMFPLNVTEELARWPEMDVRWRRWVTVAEAREGCNHLWMKEALDRLVRRLSSSRRRKSFS
ncbi:nudix hydrolase 18, mitochondrial-like [Iris pallida]|uniref:Nudix hydrolase 18, mitochondrial-like n=1 Tax=Iris pallida TaxID=29817 RepID=A0AAX6ENS0_IRIPA|nr:nudix hydrolase 18, mitochondrial-like [Iris pallida]